MKMPSVVEDKFDEFVREKVDESRAFNYAPTTILSMLGNLGAYATVVKLLTTPITTGYNHLWQAGRLDLSVEALVLEHEWWEYFDPALLSIAEKRLRDHEYEPQIPSRINDVLLSIEWSETVEHIPLNLATLKAGDELETVEVSSKDAWQVTYLVKCKSVERARDGWLVLLEYDALHRENSLRAERNPNLEWGVTSIDIKADRSSATARFTAEGATVVAEGKVKFIESSLFQVLTRAQVGVLLRPGQAALRSALLQQYGRCAISNETCKDALEVAHIIEHSAGGVADVGNALLLRADIHSLYDAGRLTIDGNGSILLMGVDGESGYHLQARDHWNATLKTEVLQVVRRALRERGKRQGD